MYSSGSPAFWLFTQLDFRDLILYFGTSASMYFVYVFTVSAQLRPSMNRLRPMAFKSQSVCSSEWVTNSFNTV